jgi:hypothetical protein
MIKAIMAKMMIVMIVAVTNPSLSFYFYPAEVKDKGKTLVN